MIEAAERPADRMVSAIVGIAGLPATLAAVRKGTGIALANKESLVCAGPLLIREANAAAPGCCPTDSEHNAIFQVLDRPERVEKLILTASGGPFRKATLPTWRQRRRSRRGHTRTGRWVPKSRSTARP